MIRILPVLLLSGCAVGWSPSIIRDVQPNETVLYTVSVSGSYPKVQFMNADEWNEYRELPPFAQDRMMEYYKQREKDRERWTELLNCWIQVPPDLECQ